MRSHFFISPLISHLVCLILGISAQKIYSINASLLLVVFISTLLVITTLLIFRKNNRLVLFPFVASASNHSNAIKRSSLISRTALYALSAITGALLLALQINNYNSLAQRYSGNNLAITGTITHLEQDKLGAFKELYHVAVTSIQTTPDAPWTNASFSLQVYARKHSHLTLADSITISGVSIKPPAKNDAIGSSFVTYLIKEELMASLFLSETTTVTRIHHPTWSVARTLWYYKNSVQRHIKSRLSKISGSMFGLIFLGNKNQESLNLLRDTFNYWGLAHYLARSGLHIVLFIIIWSFMFKILPLHLYIKRSLLLLLTIAYAGFSWPSISFDRAFLVFLLMQLGSLCAFIPNMLHVLSITCLSMLLCNPIQLFFLDFQLTFLLTFALLFLSTLKK